MDEIKHIGLGGRGMNFFKIVILIIIMILLVVGFLYLYPGVGRTPTKADMARYAAVTDRVIDGVFTNIREIQNNMRDQYAPSDRRKPTDVIPVEKIETVEKANPSDLNVYWLGHSSLLVQLGDKNILIDPVLTDFASPVGFVGVKRFSDIPIMPEKLPNIDMLLLSHDHYDHLDYQTVMEIKDRVGMFVVPLGVETYLLGWGIPKEKITVMSWWDEAAIDDISVTATPCQHFSGRNPLKSNTSWWCGYVFSDANHTVYYTGDGGYTDEFKEIGQKFDIDLALVECGQYDPAWRSSHMYPEESAQAAKDVGAKWIIPVHFGAFCICNHAWDDSIIRIMNVKDEMDLNIATPIIGQKVVYDEIDTYNNAWWETIN